MENELGKTVYGQLAPVFSGVNLYNARPYLGGLALKSIYHQIYVRLQYGPFSYKRNVSKMVTEEAIRNAKHNR